jgi:hypothetical protein
MNNKHLACVVLLLLIALLAQLTLSLNKRTAKVEAEAERMKATLANNQLQLMVEKGQFAELANSSKPLTDYLGIWQPYFKAVDSAQSAELKVSLRIKDANLVSLSQKFDSRPNQGSAYLPSVARAQLTFEDGYAKLLNWLGKMESELPTLRTRSIILTRGNNPDDVRMQLVLEQPLAKLQ